MSQSHRVRRVVLVAVAVVAVVAVVRRPGRPGGTVVPAIGGDTWPPVPVKDTRTA
jgi:hypothetical protein